MDRPTDRRSLSACSEPDCEEDEGSELEMLQGWMELEQDEGDDCAHNLAESRRGSDARRPHRSPRVVPSNPASCMLNLPSSWAQSPCLILRRVFRTSSQL